MRRPIKYLTYNDLASDMLHRHGRGRNDCAACKFTGLSSWIQPEIRISAGCRSGFLDREQPAVLENRVAIGHAGDVIGDGSRRILLRAYLEFRG
jgi:hypothetical protein